jgi:DNA-binding LytR/AlgR family response regulator
MKAREALATQDIDIVFSDINMPELSGMSLLKSFSVGKANRKGAPVFIFVSGSAEYAVESYDLNVIDYIVKPVTLERVLKSANKAIEYLDMKNLSEKQVTSTLRGENYFFIRESNDLVKLHFEDVAYIESMGDFSKIYTISDKRHITLVSLKNLEMQLPGTFFTRIHKQYIVNHQHISAISADELIVHGKYTLPLSQSLKQSLLDKVVNKKMVTRHLGKDN